MATRFACWTANFGFGSGEIIDLRAGGIREIFWERVGTLVATVIRVAIGPTPGRPNCMALITMPSTAAMPTVKAAFPIAP